MAPRKTNKDTAVKKPATRKRVQVQQKKPFKTPTLLKLKITTPKLDPDSSTPKLTDKQRKIELANEVSLAQLYKNAEITDNVTTTEPKKTKTKKNTKNKPLSKPKPPQKRQKTISEFFNETSEAESAVVTKQTPKKIIKKTPVPKKRKTEISCPKIKSADSTVRKGRPQKKQKETTLRAPRNLRSKKQPNVNETGNGKEARPATVSSRTNSGASSTPSWTRDISSSSTTTCVTVGDFVRIDQRLPVLQLPDIVASRAQPLTAATAAGPAPVPVRTPSIKSGSASSSTSSSSTSSSSSSSLSATGSEAASPALDSPPTLLQPTADVLNLSSSSSHRIEKEAATFDMAALFRLLVEGQKKLNRAFDDLMRQCDEPASSDTDGRVVQALDDLTFEPIMVECRQVRQILKGEKQEEEEGEDDMKVDQHVITASKEVGYRDTSGPKNDVEQNVVEEGNYVDDGVSSNENYMHFDHSPDDEDAISLFAESTFTDCGSTRRDEYVPRPIKTSTAARPASARVYKPSPITSTLPHTDVPGPDPTDGPLLISDLYQPKHCTKSAVFHGTCFYYIAGGNCRNPMCRYPHIDIAIEEVDRRIAALGEVDFIQEYMLVRSSISLWRLYGLRYLYEAERRELTRLVLEMAIDFTMKARVTHEGYTQEQVAHEAALTRLSCDEGSVQACADLLRMPVPNTIGNRPLQYLLLHTLSNTANFSRFKRAFIDLAALLVADGLGKRLDPGPIVKILERVCILPYEERLVRAMLALVQQTDAAAVSPLMSQFKTLVSALPDEVRHPRDQPSPSPVPYVDPPPPPPPALRDDPPPMTKPIITRTVDFLRMRGYPSRRQFQRQWKWPRGRASSRGYPGQQHLPIFRRRTPTHFTDLK